MAESAIIKTSIDLYHYLCQNIVGTEKDVKAIRIINNVRDNLNNDKTWTMITSGSFGEGLIMRGSDVDVMRVFKHFYISEDTSRSVCAHNIHLTMEMEDTQPGFTKLRLLHTSEQSILEFCYDIGNDFYFSNLSFKRNFTIDIFPTLHGPCITDKDGLYDIAYCVHSKLWISPAKKWITRSNTVWPSYDVKQAIVKHGVLFVPVGVKGSTQEEFEWRISFSVGEKLLIYSFTHTQLLCYALLKILLKDVIALDVDCKELLCSYFMKTILFWICEELPLSLWKPENLISCYMRCFRRLIYCAEYACCPHYFIPENNLFGNKIHGKAQKLLLNRLYILNSYGWQCILLSDQISKLYAVPSDSSMETSYSYPKSVQRLLNSDMLILETATNPFKFLIERVIYKVLLGKSSTIKYIYAYYLSIICGQSDRYVPLGDISCNTSTYKEYNTYISALLLYTRHDATSGWLMLSTFFYKRKQYHTALHNIQYSVLKCTPEKLYYSMQLSDIHNALLNLHVFRNMPIVQLWKFLLVGFIRIRKSELQPDELQTVERNRFPPIVYAHFLRFLCHYHLKNSRQCLDSLKELQFTIEGNYFTSGDVFKGISYNILGIGFQLLGYREAARQSFIQSIELFPNEKHNSAFRKLPLLN